MLHHAVVKHADVEPQERAPYLKRLALRIITEERTDQSELFYLTSSKPQDIDVVMTADKVDVENARRALDGTVTYAETIKRAGVKWNIPCQAVHDPHRGGSRPQCSMLHKSM